MILDSINPKVLIKHLLSSFVGLQISTDAPVPLSGINHNGLKTTLLSAFPIEINGSWLLATAGHNITNLRNIQNKGHKLSLSLFDRWHDTQNSLDAGDEPLIPISAESIDEKHSIAINQKDGLDIGFIFLRPNTRDLLATKGIQPFPIAGDYLDSDAFSEFTMLGLPGIYENISSSKGTTTIKESPCLIRLSPPIQCPTNLAHLTAPLLYFTLPDDDNHGHFPRLDNPDGMSGGPICGYRKDANGKLLRQLIGVMTAYEPKTCTAVVAPFEYIRLFWRNLFDVAGAQHSVQDPA